MTTDKRYNGWANYETWAVKLWMDNEEPSYRYWKEQAEFLASAEGYKAHRNRVGYQMLEPERVRVHALAEQLKEEHESALPEVEGFASDLLYAAFGEVDWFEIAESLLTDVRETQI